MKLPEYKELLDAGVHFGHMKKKWNPKMKPYIFVEKKGIHIIDLNRTAECLEHAGAAMKSIAKSGRKIMFIGTKKQVKEIISQAADSVNMPHVTERWLGGMMTNFATIRKSVKKMNSIDKMLTDSTYSSITKKEKLTLSREKEKLYKVLGGISKLNRLPAAVFIVDPNNEHLALEEAHKLGLRVFGIVDTNCNPNDLDFPIPANDDASKSVKLITDYLIGSIKEGLEERNANKDDKDEGDND